MRREFPAKIRAAAFQRSGGDCENCTARLYPAKFTYDHILPDWLGGEPMLGNCQVICSTCDKQKTHKEDQPRIAKTKRIRDKHIGAKPTSRSFQSKFRKKVSGEVVLR